MRIAHPDAGYPIEAVLGSLIRDAVRYRMAKIPAACCSPTKPCAEHVETADCVAAYHWLAQHFGIDLKETA